MTPDEFLVLHHAAPELSGDVFRPLNERHLAMKADLWRNRVARALNNMVARGVLRRQLRETRGWDSYRLNAKHPDVKALLTHKEGTITL